MSFALPSGPPGQSPTSGQTQTAISSAVERLLGGEVLADIHEIPDEQLDAAFARACDLVDAEDFDAAIDILAMLAIFDPYDFRFQFGFGLCLQQLGRTADAAKSYALAYLLDPADAGCAFRIGECHAALGDREAAEAAFTSAIALCEPPKPHPDIRIACESSLANLYN